MSSMPVPRITTAEELLSLDEPGICHELVRGQLRRTSPAGHWHGGVEMVLCELLSHHVRVNKLGRAYSGDTGFLMARNPDTVLSPDAAFVTNERMPPPRSRGYFPGPPDLAVEIRSPDDMRRSLHRKALSWLRHGARMVWVIDPMAADATVYRSKDDVRDVGADGDLLGEDVVPGLRVALRELFRAD